MQTNKPKLFNALLFISLSTAVAFTSCNNETEKKEPEKKTEVVPPAMPDSPKVAAPDSIKPVAPKADSPKKVLKDMDAKPLETKSISTKPPVKH